MTYIIRPSRFASGTIVSDTFTDTNGTLITAHTPDTSPGGVGYTAIEAANMDTPEIQSNYLLSTYASPRASFGGGLYLFDCSESDVVITLDVYSGDSSTGDAFGVCFRQSGSDFNNFWRCYVLVSGTSSGFGLEKRVSGSPTLADLDSTSLSYDTWYTIQVTLSGSSISATLDGGSPIGTTDTDLQSNTKHGLMVRQYAGTARFDNLLIESN